MIGLLRAIMGIAGAIASYIGDKQLMDAGEAKAISRNISATLEQIDKARAARKSVKHDADSVRDDPHNRD